MVLSRTLEKVFVVKTHKVDSYIWGVVSAVTTRMSQVRIRIVKESMSKCARNPIHKSYPY